MANLLRDKIGSTIKELRVRKGMTQEELAREAGMTTRNLQRCEKGQVTPYYRNIVAIASALEVEPDQLLGYEKLPTRDGDAPLAQFVRDLAVLEARVEELTAWKRDTDKYLQSLKQPDVRF